MPEDGEAGDDTECGSRGAARARKVGKPGLTGLQWVGNIEKGNLRRSVCHLKYICYMK